MRNKTANVANANPANVANANPANVANANPANVANANPANAVNPSPANAEGTGTAAETEGGNMTTSENQKATVDDIGKHGAEIVSGKPTLTIDGTTLKFEPTKFKELERHMEDLHGKNIDADGGIYQINSRNRPSINQGDENKLNSILEILKNAEVVNGSENPFKDINSLIARIAESGKINFSKLLGKAA